MTSQVGAVVVAFLLVLWVILSTVGSVRRWTRLGDKLRTAIRKKVK